MRFLVYPFLTLVGIAASQTILVLLLDSLGLVGPRFSMSDLVIGGLMLAVAGGLASYAMARHMVEQGLKGERSADADADHGIAKAVARLSKAMNIKAPALAVYQSQLVDAIGAGPLPSHALVAISSALVQRVNQPEADAVLAHALARVKSGDAAFLPFIQGMIHIYTLFPARMMALLLGTTLRTAEEDTPSDPVETIMIVCLDAVFTLGGSLVVRHYARAAERRADRTAIQVVGKTAFAAGLSAYQASKEPHRDSFSASLRFGAHVTPLARFFSYHVPLTGRLKSAT
jgi:heat shock protein HtpX